MQDKTLTSIYDELVPQVGHDNFMRAFNHISVLVEELILLIKEASAWGKSNAYPEADQYPQYQRIRELGHEFHKLAGLGGMQTALKSAQRRLSDYPPTKFNYSVITYGWSGIGGWQA
jgi:hypothetical protein